MIEGTDLYEFFSCPYKVYNRHNRDRSLMVPFSEFSRHLMEMGKEHEQEIIKTMKVHQPDYKKGDFEDGFEKTVKLMKQGVDFIYQGVLMDGDKLGIPDLLIKQEGKSNLGEWHYIPADIKSSIRSKEEQIMQLMFYNMLLDSVQKHNAQKAIVILKNCSEMIELEKYYDKFLVALEKIEKISNGLEYGMHIDTVCKECPWRNVCIPLAEQKHDVSLIYGLSRPIHYKLIGHGINTYEDLANADSAALSEIEGVGNTSVHKWKEQANVLITKKDKITKIKLANVEHICLDIESTEDGRVYLIGLWQNNKFVHFFSEDNEKKIVEDFVDYVSAIDSYALYHYGSIEKTMFKTLFEKYEIPREVGKKIISNMVDLLPIVKKNAILPLSYYNLKEVAKHFGFKWRASDASGSNSMSWYQNWFEHRDPELLKKILSYNEDDVHATYIILKKLAEDELP